MFQFTNFAPGVSNTVCASAAQRMSRTIGIGDSLQNAFEKQDLLSDLSATQEEMEKTNQALLNEHEERERVQAALEVGERHFRVLVETSGDVIWSVDAEGRYTYINGPVVQAILGYKSEEVIGRPITDFAHAASASALAAEFQLLKETAGASTCKANTCIVQGRTGWSDRPAWRLGVASREGLLETARDATMEAAECVDKNSITSVASENKAILISRMVPFPRRMKHPTICH